MLLLLCVVTGCKTCLHNNPFSTFSQKDIAKIVICFEKTIYGPYESFDNPEEPNDNVLPAQSYLEPSGYAIKSQQTISRLYNIAKEMPRDRGYPTVGILSYQVYLNKNGKVLGITHIVNWKGYVCFDRGYVQNGWIHLEEDNFAGRSIEYCKIIYDFMKKNMPDKIKEINEIYKKQGGLEKLLFGNTSNIPNNCTPNSTTPTQPPESPPPKKRFR